MNVVVERRVSRDGLFGGKCVLVHVADRVHVVQMWKRDHCHVGRASVGTNRHRDQLAGTRCQKFLDSFPVVSQGMCISFDAGRSRNLHVHCLDRGALQGNP